MLCSRRLCQLGGREGLLLSCLLALASVHTDADVAADADAGGMVDAFVLTTLGAMASC